MKFMRARTMNKNKLKKKKPKTLFRLKEGNKKGRAIDNISFL
jgi:hypothetical protein